MDCTYTWIIWLFISVFFFWMSWDENEKSKRRLESLDKFIAEGRGAVIGKLSINESFSALREELNASKHASHKSASRSYFIGGVVAVVSLLLSISC